MGFFAGRYLRRGKEWRGVNGCFQSFIVYRGGIVILMSRPLQLRCLLTVVVFATMACAGWWWSRQVTPEATYQSAWISLKKNDWKGVSKSIDDLKTSPGHASHRHLLRGALLLRTGNAPDALPELLKAEQDERLREPAWLLLCESHYVIKNLRLAVKFANAVLSLNPEQPEAHRWLGAIYFDLGAMSLAETHLKTLAELTPNDYSPHRLLGLIHGDFEQFKVAIADYHQALQRNPPKPVELEIRRELAKSLIHMNEFSQGLETLQADWPTDEVRARTLRAECLWTLSRPDEARQELAIAEKHDPRNVPLLQLKASIAFTESRPDDAIRFLEQAAEIEPVNDRTFMDLSAAYRRLGKTELADQFLEKRNVARGLFEQMVKLNRRAVEEPNNSEIRRQLAEICLKLGKPQLAATWREAARAMDAELSQ